MSTIDETVKAMKEALEGDPKKLLSDLAHIIVQFFNRELIN